MQSDYTYDLWESSRYSSRAYWDFYNRVIGPIKSANQADDTPEHSELTDHLDITSDVRHSLETEYHDQVNEEYLDFIRVTREHQAERQRLKELELKKKSDVEIEEYYQDISQVNTLVEDNLVEAPSKDHQKPKEEDELMIKLYGSRDNYDRIRSLEMYIDEHFSQKCLEFKPRFWPVIPLNPKPYLNPYN